MPLRPVFLPYIRYALIIVAGSLAAVLATLVDRYERDFAWQSLEWKSATLVVAFTFFLSTIFALLSRRVIASIAVACGLMVLTTTISIVKFQYLRVSLHALDFYYYGRPTELVFLYQHFRPIFVTALAILVAVIAISWLLFVVDDSRITRRTSASAFLVATVLLASSYAWLGQRSKVYHFNGYFHASAAIASAPEALGIFWRGGFLEGADKGGTINSDPVPSLQNAIPGAKHPTIISVLHESTFPIGMYPVQCGGPALDALYRSSNGKRYDLRVETFGGATWLTEYGLNLGLSTYYFGEARSFIGYSMEGRVHDSLALQLKQDGYQTIALYPSPRTFVNTGRFYPSIGYDKVLDYYDMHQSTELERDRFFYAKTLDEIRAHKASGSTAPLFVFNWTMSTHAPYDYAIYPSAKPAPTEVCGKSRIWAEYIRRLLIAQDDLEWFKDQLKSQFPDEPFMILAYGDHQPFISQEFLESAPSTPGIPSKNTIGYRTYFSLTGINFEPDFSVVPQSVDTPFLGNVMMLAARLPRHGFYNDRDKLMLLCQGRYNDCPHQDEILSFHERLIKSSAIDNR